MKLPPTSVKWREPENCVQIKGHISVEKIFIIAHYMPQLCRPNLEINLGMVAGNLLSYPES